MSTDNYWSQAKAKWDERAEGKPYGSTSAARSKEEHEERGRSDFAILSDLLEKSGARWGTGFEIGCGNGRILKHFAGRFKTLHGGDLSPKMLEQARPEAPGATLHVLEGTRLPVDGLDVVYSYGVFQHCPRDVFRTYVAEAARALLPGGLFLFHLLRPYTLRRKLKALFRRETSVDQTWNIRYYTWGELRSIAAANGFQVVQERTDELDIYTVWRK